MSEPDSCVGDQAPPVLESHFSTKLHISEPGDECCQPQSSPARQCETLQEDVNREAVPEQALLSTQSPAALKTGTRQLIPKNLATASRPRTRYHTTVVTLPVSLQKSISGSRSRHSTQGPDVSWEDYDSDGDGFALRRNRRNKSYRAAVTSLDFEAMAAGQGSAATLKPVRQQRAPSPCPGRSPRRKVSRPSSPLKIHSGI